MTERHIVGYQRISTASQSLDLQRRALLEAGVPEDHIYEDVITGASLGATRPGLSAALAQCREGSTLVVWRLDRLGRSMQDVLTTVDALTARGVALRSLTEGISADTSSGRLLLGLLATLGEHERNLIRERVQAGMDAARQRGVRLGRPAPDPSEVAAKVRMARRAIAEDGLPAADAARLVGWSRSSLYRHMKAVPA